MKRFADIFAVFLLFVFIPGAALSQEIDCLKCHAKLKSGKVVHGAMDMGCLSCHTGIDASAVPHKKTNAIGKGLSAEQPELCYGCHDKSKFTLKNVHPAVSMGCTGCHNPHSSANARLLIAAAPDLCFTCHDKAEFSKKNPHAPVKAGKCLGCHSPHASQEMALLLKKPVEVCLECHPNVPNKPHAIAGFSSNSHPIGMPKPVKVRKDKKDREPAPAPETMDPARPGKVFYCGSCHDPHGSDSMKLFRYKVQSSMGLCVICHKM